MVYVIEEMGELLLHNCEVCRLYGAEESDASNP